MGSELTSAHIVRQLAADDRRRIVAALVLSEDRLTSSELAAASGLSLRQVVDAVDRLCTAGLVDQSEAGYLLLEDVFQQAARSEAPPAPVSEHSDQPVDVARILDASFQDGKLTQWPAKRSKRLVVLDYLAQQFDIGMRYSERDTNDILRSFNDDVATMRRYLVDEQFLDRGEGQYWRCGGTI